MHDEIELEHDHSGRTLAATIRRIAPVVEPVETPNYELAVSIVVRGGEQDAREVEQAIVDLCHFESRVTAIATTRTQR